MWTFERMYTNTRDKHKLAKFQVMEILLADDWLKRYGNDTYALFALIAIILSLVILM